MRRGFKRIIIKPKLLFSELGRRALVSLEFIIASKDIIAKKLGEITFGGCCSFFSERKVIGYVL